MNPFLPESVQERLVLASASPRRRALLAGLGFEFVVEPSRYIEVNGEEDDPAKAARRHALGKAREVAARIPGSLVIGADTLVVEGGRLMGKPVGADEARAMLRRLSGREHEVLTGVALACASAADAARETLREAGASREVVELARTRVRFRDLDEAEIDAYLASGEPFDKAGAYGIQGLASQFVSGIEGCYFNVMGLPLELLTRMLRAWAEGEPGGGV